MTIDDVSCFAYRNVIISDEGTCELLLSLYDRMVQRNVVYLPSGN